MKSITSSSTLRRVRESERGSVTVAPFFPVFSPVFFNLGDRFDFP